MKTDDLFLTELEPAHHALDTWRRRRKRREPIPETLWDLIVPLARAHGLSPVSRALRLDYYGLQRRVLSERAPDVGPAQEPHFVELSLGALQSPQDIKLFLTGWVRPTDTSLNIAISQRPDLESTQPPSIWVPDAKGEWQQVRPFMGFPGGKTKTIVVDLSGLFPTHDYRVRIATTMELFWDQIFFTTDEAAVEVVSTEMPLRGASLRYRGFSTLIPPVGFGPDRYDYGRESPLISWPPLDGRLTPYGDVTGFVRAQDNRQVTIGAGDEMELRFAVAGSGPKPGWKRDFILHNVGWDKDADLNTVFGQTIDPLPFVGMSGYPDPNGPGDQPPFANQVRRQDRTKFWRLFDGGKSLVIGH